MGGGLAGERPRPLAELCRCADRGRLTTASLWGICDTDTTAGDARIPKSLHCRLATSRGECVLRAAPRSRSLGRETRNAPGTCRGNGACVRPSGTVVVLSAAATLPPPPLSVTQSTPDTGVRSGDAAAAEDAATATVSGTGVCCRDAAAAAGVATPPVTGVGRGDAAADDTGGSRRQYERGRPWYGRRQHHGHGRQRHGRLQP